MSLERRQIEFEGIDVVYWQGGSGAPLLLLHGSGPGANTFGNWRLVIDELAARFHVIAPDLIGFGESGRKAQGPYFDFDLWVRQAAFFLDRFDSRPVNVLGHSLSGAVALKLASGNPKVRKVATTGSIGAAMPANEHLEVVWSFPETRDDLIRAGETLVYDRSLVTDTYLEAREKILHAGDYRTYYETMFAGNKQRYLDASVLSEAALAAVVCDVLMIHGVDDLPTPIESSFRIARKIERADVLALARCGHSVALEHPGKLIDFASAFFRADPPQQTR